MSTPDPRIAAGLAKAGVATAQRHIFLCLGPDCCAPMAGERTWETIKRRIRETGIPVMRTKAACLRVCAGGPWLVVYPDGIWYGEVTPDRFDRILQEHLVGGHPVGEWIATTHSLPGVAKP